MKLFIYTLLFSLLSNTLFSQNIDFKADNTSICLGDSIKFSSLCTFGPNTFDEYTWDFGDGNTIISKNTDIYHSFSSPGSYEIRLLVSYFTPSNSKIVTAVTKTNYVTINPTPLINYNYNLSCSAPYTLQLINNSSTGNNYIYNWDFGNTQTSNSETPTNIVYGSTGNYSITLTITDNLTNCISTDSKNITVSNYSTNFSLLDSICIGSFVNLNDNSTNADTWNWLLDGNSISTSSNFTTSLNSSGNHTITLQSSNSMTGCSSSKSKQIYVANYPYIDFSTTDTIGCSPLSVAFKNNSTSGIKYEWIFDNFNSPNTITTNNNTTVNHQYSSNSNNTYFSVLVKAYGLAGCNTTLEKQKYIQLVSPKVNFSIDQSKGCSILSSNFTDLSSNPNSSDPIIKWNWDFGNGQTSTLKSPPTQQFTTGIYDISLSIETQNGCKVSLDSIKSIQVGKIDLVNFSYNPTTICAKKDTISFKDLSVISVPHQPNEVTYKWDFGDGGTSTLKDPTYNYPIDTGYFSVSLVLDFRGCKDTMKMDSIVFAKPAISNFSIKQPTVCNPSSFPVKVEVTNSAKDGRPNDNVSMIWRWGTTPNTNTTYNGDTSHLYTNYGVYTLKQVVYNYTTGCHDSTTQTLVISSASAKINLLNDSICNHSSMSFNPTNSVSNPSDLSPTYIYNYGDGIIDQFGIHQYNTSGKFKVLQRYINQYGCQSIDSADLTVLALPIASITPKNTGGCAPLTVNYTSNSYAQGNGVTTINQYFWTLPDQSTSTNNQVNYLISTEGSFTTQLEVTDIFGCHSQNSDAVTITTTSPNVIFSVDTVICNNASITALNSSVGFGNLTYSWILDNTSVANSKDYTKIFNEIKNPLNSHNEHNLRLVVTDQNGCKDSISSTIHISTPTAKGSYAFTGTNMSSASVASCPPVISTYTNQSNSYLPYNLAWNFGDGKKSINKNPINTFVYPGTYDLELILTDNIGCKDTFLTNNYLTIFGPTSQFTLTDTTINCRRLIIVDTINTSNINHIEWIFDTNDSTNISPAKHYYLSQGTYYPTLKIYDINNCVVTYPIDTLNVTLNSLNANYFPSQIIAPMGTDINFTNISVGSNINYNAWSTGEYMSSPIIYNSNSDLIYNYGAPGTYTTSLIIGNNINCKDTAYIKITITGDLNFPNVITANNDEKNDLFELPTDMFINFDIEIINRWGEVVYSKEKQTGTKVWDGKNNDGFFVTDGVYYYTISGQLKSSEFYKKTDFITKLGGTN